jgi:hypothetical protein
MLQNYTKVFIHKAILVAVPGALAPEFINTLSTTRRVQKWLKGCYKEPEKQVIEIGIDHEFWSLFMSLHHQIIAGGGWVRNPEGQLLVIERNGKLDLPKGKLESKESIAVCAVREVQEECRVKRCEITGPAVKTYHCYLHKGAFALKTTFWFPMITDYSKKLKPQTDEGISAVYWATPERVKQRLAEIPSYNSLEEVFLNFVATES